VHASRREVVLTLLCAAGLAAPVFGISPVNKSLLGGVAIEGYDPVAYFPEGKAIKGRKEHRFDWRGAAWRFASEANRDLFAREPERYAPQYGGYCAWAVAHGYTAGIDPEAWTVHDGKLYLNYDEEIEAKWRADRTAQIAAADEAWPKLLAD
jgi:YHS domain-containing protein